MPDEPEVPAHRAHPVRLRRPTPDDAHGIARVHVETWQAAYAGVLPEDFLRGLDVGRRATGWSRILGDAAHAQPGEGGSQNGIWLAAAGDEVVGFAWVGPARDEDLPPGGGELFAVYLLPEWWGRGVGARLLGAAEGDLRAAGYRWATLWVLEQNPRARAAYERAGWRADGTKRTEPIGETEVVEVRYRLELA